MAQRTQLATFEKVSDSASDTTIVLPNTGSIASIQAGSLVRFGIRYEGAAGTTASATDSAGATYTHAGTMPAGDGSVTVHVFYKHNHPGGTNVTITVTLGASRGYRAGQGEVVSGTVGESDPITGTPDGDENGSSGPMSCTVTGVSGDCDVFMEVGSFSGSTWGTASGSEIVGDDTYSAAFKQHYTGSGNKTITHTGGTGITRGFAVGFVDGGGGTTSANLINSNLLAGRLLRGLKG